MVKSSLWVTGVEGKGRVIPKKLKIEVDREDSPVNIEDSLKYCVDMLAREWWGYGLLGHFSVSRKDSLLGIAIFTIDNKWLPTWGALFLGTWLVIR